MKQSWLLRFRKSPPHTQTNIVCTAVIMVATIAYAIIAGFQLNAMRGTLAEMKRSGEQSTAQMWSAISNINWMARSMDLSQKTAQQGIQAGELENSDTLKATIDSFHSDQRAWVGIESATTSNLSSDATAHVMNMTVKFVLRNYGRSAAERLRIFADLTTASSVAVTTPICNDTGSKYYVGDVIFPSQPREYNLAMKISLSDLEVSIRRNPKLGRNVLLMVRGCVKYIDRPTEKVPHHTPISYFVLRADGGGFITPETVSLPGSSLILSPNSMNSGPTD